MKTKKHSQLIWLAFSIGVLLLSYHYSASRPQIALTNKNNNLQTQTDTIVQKFDEVTLGCLARGRDNGQRVINSEEEYESLWNYRAPHPDCISYVPPSIDFKTKTLILYTGASGGCKPPDIIEKNVYKIISQKKYIVVLRLKANGMCQMLHAVFFDLTLPKIEPDYDVQFEGQ